LETKSPFNLNNPDLTAQAEYLATLTAKDIEPLMGYCNSLKESRFEQGSGFSAILQTVYNLKLVFDYAWMDWEEGRKNLRNPEFDFNAASLLECSMYITCIFRADRFMEGTIEGCIKNGSLGKIFEALKNNVSN
jgi:hypothetical protein